MAAKTAFAMAGAAAMIGVSPPPAGRDVPVLDQVDVDPRDVPEAGHAVAGEARVQDLPVLELELLGERPPERHDDAALHLREEVRGVQDGAALEGLADLGRPRCGPSSDRPSPRRRRRRPSPSPSRRRGPRRARASPACAARAQPNSFAAFSSTARSRAVLEVGQPELEGIGAGGRRQLVHEGLAGEVVGGGPQAPIGALGQGGVRAHGGDPHVRDGVGRARGPRPRG